MHTLEPCPGCPASFARYDGATHPYIGASAACWALHCAVLIGGEPPVDVLVASSVAPVHVSIIDTSPNASALLIDAYAAQHHGVPSPQAIQSVAVHLLALHGVLARAVSPDAALWIRRQAMRKKNVYTWLAPPRVDSAYALRHCFPSEGLRATCSLDAYVGSVYTAWQTLHRQQLDQWYDAFVAA